MSKHTDKKARTTTHKFELLYWPGTPGRGEPVRLLLEEAGADYRDLAKEKDGIKELLATIGTDFEASGENIPPLAPPILRTGDLMIAQSTNIMLYLGEHLEGLVPGDVSVNKYRVNQLAQTAMDLANEAHNTHHPCSVSKYYKDQMEAAADAATAFRDERIPKFFGYFERVIASSEGPYLLSDFSYADLVVWSVVDGTRYAFPKAANRAFEKTPKLKELYDTVGKRPRISAYLTSERRAKYGDGIFRHYPELDL